MPRLPLWLQHVLLIFTLVLLCPSLLVVDREQDVRLLVATAFFIPQRSPLLPPNINIGATISLLRRSQPPSKTSTMVVSLVSQHNADAVAELETSNAASSSDVVVIQQVTRRKQEERRSAAAAVPKTIRDAVRVFLFDQYNGPRIVVAMLLLLASYRFAIIPTTYALGIADGVVVVTSIIFWCFQEHVMHDKLLHSKFNWYGKQIHEHHHAQEYFNISIDPAILMISWLGVIHLLLRWLLPLPLALSATIGYACAGLVYEWAHYIAHTKVSFRKGSYWYAVKNHHKRHHLISNQHNLAFSIPAIDVLLGTNDHHTKK